MDDVALPAKLASIAALLLLAGLLTVPDLFLPVERGFCLSRRGVSAERRFWKSVFIAWDAVRSIEIRQSSWNRLKGRIVIRGKDESKIRIPAAATDFADAVELCRAMAEEYGLDIQSIT